MLWALHAPFSPKATTLAAESTAACPGCARYGSGTQQAVPQRLADDQPLIHRDAVAHSLARRGEHVNGRNGGPSGRVAVAKAAPGAALYCAANSKNRIESILRDSHQRMLRRGPESGRLDGGPRSAQMICTPVYDGRVKWPTGERCFETMPLMSQLGLRGSPTFYAACSETSHMSQGGNDELAFWMWNRLHLGSSPLVATLRIPRSRPNVGSEPRFLVRRSPNRW